MPSESAPKPDQPPTFRRARQPVTPGDTLHAREGDHYQPYDTSLRILGDLRLRITVVPPVTTPAREGFLLLRGYVVDTEGFESVRESWHYVRLARCSVAAPPGRQS